MKIHLVLVQCSLIFMSFGRIMNVSVLGIYLLTASIQHSRIVCCSWGGADWLQAIFASVHTVERRNYLYSGEFS